MLIELTFIGTANAIRFAGGEPGQYFHIIGGPQPYTANFVFDTSLGTLSDHRLDGGLVYASITTEMFGIWGGGPFNFQGAPWLTWDDALTTVTAVAAPASHWSLNVTNITQPLGGHYGSFQFGVCPTAINGPCGYIASVDSLTVVGIPAPIVGSGISSLILTFIIVRSIQWAKKKRA